MAESPEFHFADVFETVAGVLPERTAIVQGSRSVTWRAFDRRANALAADLLDAGLGRSAKVAAYLYNCPEYLETYFAATKVAMWPVNTNYRYGVEEITYLFDNADAEAVVFDTAFTPVLDVVRGRLPGIRRWYGVGERVPDWAVPYESVVGSSHEQAPVMAWPRSGADVIMTYTGGTTGMPKGVMWSHRELIRVTGSGGNAVLGVPPSSTREELAEKLGARTEFQVVLEACPLMHATALGNAYGMLSMGATIALLDRVHFDPVHLWDEVDRLGVTWLTIVGDAFARPLLAALQAQPGRWDLGTLRVVYSAGVMWSHEVKQAMLDHLSDDVILLDVFGSTEAAGMGSSVSTKNAVAETAAFRVGDLAQVLSEDGSFVVPGSGVMGMAAFGGPMPDGYYKDEKKTAETFRTINGKRWSVPGDFATVEADGTMRLLGRGSVCINTAGEKVFVEEVEEILKLHPQVHDAVCVGIPDPRFGETVCAIVEPRPGVETIDGASVIDHVKGRLAGYKAPKDVVQVDSIQRAPSGKVDYATLKSLARRRLGR
jgi:3-oxocholest-4-en-26-oate---CoA ligase